MREDLQKWVDALRSGEYIQGYFSLCNKDSEGSIKHCAWGVYADVNKIGRVKPRTSWDSYFGCTNRINEELRNRFNIGWNMIVIMNDEKGYDFNTIADKIEEGVLDEFTR